MKEALAASLLLAALPALAHADDADGKKGDTAPTSSAVVARVDQILHVTVKPLTGGRVQLEYDMANDTDMQDFEAQDVEGPQVLLLKTKGATGRFPDIGVPRDSSGTFLNKLPFKGEIQLECQVVFREFDPDYSDMALLMGYEPKTRKWVGARFGQAILVSDGRKVSLAPGSDPIEIEPLGNFRHVTLKLVRKGKKISAYLNGQPKGTFTTSQGDGRWGFLLSSVHVAFVDKVVVSGVPDLPPEKR